MKVKLSPVQIAQKVFDAVSEAIKVKITDTEFNMQLDHNDGDSVYVYKKPVEHKVTLAANSSIVLDYDFSHCSELSCLNDGVEISGFNELESKALTIKYPSDAGTSKIFFKKLKLKNTTDSELEVTLLSR